MKKELMYIWLQLSVGLYSRAVSEIFVKFSCIEDVYNCEDFSFLGERRDKYIKRLESKDTSDAFEILKRCNTLGVRVTGYYDELYPKGLRSVEMPPVVLYSIGELKDLNKTPCVGIVGTRNMSDYGKQTAERFAYDLAKSGVYVISGLAKGIDTAAHRGAVMADGYTVGVLGNPIGDVYPKENVKAFETLYKRGLVVSELYPGAPRTRADFPNRNRIISAISNAVIIAEAGESSGALITARHAVAQGRDVFAIPGAIGAENAGTNKLIKDGIPAATSASDVMKALLLQFPSHASKYEPSVTGQLRSYGNAEPKRRKAEVKPKETEEKSKETEVKPKETAATAPKNEASVGENTSDDRDKKLSGSASEKILACLKGNRAITVDEIAVASGLPTSEILAELTLMEIDGLVISCPGGRFISSKF